MSALLWPPASHLFEVLRPSTHPVSNNDFRPHTRPRTPCAWGLGVRLQWAWKDCRSPPRASAKGHWPERKRPWPVTPVSCPLTRARALSWMALWASVELSNQRTSTAEGSTCLAISGLPAASAPEPIGQTTCCSQDPAISLACLHKDPPPF